MINHSQYESIVTSWDDIYASYMRFSNSGKQWIFRGQPSSKMSLRSTLERAIVVFGSAGSRKLPAKAEPDFEDQKNLLYRTILAQGLVGRKRHSAFDIELSLLRKFRRQCYIYTSQLPDDENFMEWFALMRHFGAPTRLLDWTYSFFVALFFAIDGAEEDAGIWALDTDWLRERVNDCFPVELQIFDKDPNVRKDTFRELFAADKAKSMVYAVNPYRRNERLSIQQGIFLCPGRIDIPFEENLEPLLDVSNARQFFCKLTLNVNGAVRNKVLNHLQGMNVHRATLFPGLEGFAQSLAANLANPDSLVPEPF